MSKKTYIAPSVTIIGSLHESTLVGSNKYTTDTPDGILYHPTPTSPGIPLTS